MNPSVPRFDADALRGWASAVFEKCGLEPEHASTTATVLVRTDLRGIGTHGVSRIPSYVGKVLDGEVAARPHTTVSERDGVLYYDGDGGIGQVVGTNAVAAAVETARETSVVTCLISRSGHLGALGVLVLAAAEAGMVALLCAETPAFMSLPGSPGRAIGNNPLAFAAPVRGRDPLVFDISTSQTARGTILAAAREGVPIPPGWAIDRNGEPTTDAETALGGSMLPMAGHKGIGLAMMIQVLSGSLGDSRAAAAVGVESAVGNMNAFLLVLNPARMLGSDRFDSHMNRWIADYLEESGPGARYPGQRSAETERDRLATGIPLSDAVVEQLTAVGERTKVPFIVEPLR